MAVLLVAAYLVLFFHLGRGGIRQWDESSLAVNALEMSVNRNLLVKYLDGEPDLINTKPPLVIWMIVGSMAVLGYTETALRLPSALSAAVTVLVVYGFIAGALRRRTAALTAGLVLLSAVGFTGEHVARTGDYDAPLVLWITAYSLAYFLYLEPGEDARKRVWLMLTAGGLILAVMTKGIAGVLVVPGLVLYTAWRRQLREVLSAPSMYWAGLACAIVIAAYYGLREAAGPGYLEAVKRNELTGRLLEVVPGGTERGAWYNVHAMWSYRFVPWIYGLPFCWLIAYRSANLPIKRFGAFSALYVCAYLVIISSARTKFRWYDAPVYPIASAVIGIALAHVLDFVCARVSRAAGGDPRTSRPATHATQRTVVTGVAIAALCGYPYFRNAYYEVYRHGVPFRENDRAVTVTAERYKQYYRQLETSDLKLGGAVLTIVNPHRYNLPLLFYSQVAAMRGRYTVIVPWEHLSPARFSDGDTVVNCDARAGTQIRERYVVQTLHRGASCETLLVVSEIRTR